ncbi:MAG: septum formation initiator family protein [Alphaproteobacteria bacterium]|nr:septum formation initiator family protein [Alphaproteobacteria bacterium]
MGFFSYILNKTKSSSFILLLMFLCSYFAYFGIKGDRGLLKYFYLQEKVAEAEKINMSYDRQREELEQKVKLLSSSSLDLDLLDERARTVLNVIGSDEFIILDDGEDGDAN